MLSPQNTSVSPSDSSIVSSVLLNSRPRHGTMKSQQHQCNEQFLHFGFLQLSELRTKSVTGWEGQLTLGTCPGDILRLKIISLQEYIGCKFCYFFFLFIFLLLLLFFFFLSLFASWFFFCSCSGCFATSCSWAGGCSSCA